MFRNLLNETLALVTGAGQGIGAAVAMGMGQAGADVILTDVDAERCAGTVEAIRSAGGRAWAFALDVTDADACAALAARVANEIGTVNCIVNNAGILIREGIDSPQAHRNLRATVDVNLIGPFNVVHAWLPALRASRGCIINVASGAAFIGLPNTLGYSASKGGLRLLTQSMANDLAADGIRVNAIAPGVIETPMTGPTRTKQEHSNGFLGRIPMRRFGMTEELVGPVVFLASRMASYVTGATLPVDGGYLAV